MPQGESARTRPNLIFPVVRDSGRESRPGDPPFPALPLFLPDHFGRPNCGRFIAAQTVLFLILVFLQSVGCRSAFCAEQPGPAVASEAQPVPVKLTLTYQYLGKAWTEDEIKSLTARQAEKEAIDAVRNCRLTTHNTPWMIAHAILAFGRDFSLYDPDKGREVNALAFLCDDRGKLKRYGYEFFEIESDGVRVDRDEPHLLQDHIDQFLMIMSCANVGLDCPITLADGEVRTVRSILDHSMKEIHTLSEITFSLPAFIRYLPADATWENKYGMSIGIAELADKLAARPIEGRACFGTHRLYALALYCSAQGEQHRAGSPAEKALQDAIATARAMKRPSGSFGMPWYKPERDCMTNSEIIHVNGHMLTWLLICGSGPESEWLDGPCDILARTILRAVPRAEVPYGWLAHSVEALRLRLSSTDRASFADTPTLPGLLSDPRPTVSACGRDDSLSVIGDR